MITCLEHEQSSKQLQAAIDKKNKVELERFAKMDSVRAFLPLAYIYEGEMNYGKAIEFADKAREFYALDSQSASILIQRIDSIMQQQRADSIKNAEEVAKNKNISIKNEETKPDDNIKTENEKPKEVTKIIKPKTPEEIRKEKEEAAKKAKAAAIKAFDDGDAETLKRLARQGNQTAKELCEQSKLDYKK